MAAILNIVIIIKPTLKLNFFFKFLININILAYFIIKIKQYLHILVYFETNYYNSAIIFE